MTNNMTLIYDLDLETLQQIFLKWGEPSYRAGQLWEGLYKQLWDTPDQFTIFPKSLRQKLGTEFSFRSLTTETEHTSTDGNTQKTLFQLPDEQTIEAVLMRYERRLTICISTQAGCAMGCVFCATGQMGFRRNLSSGEIVEQVLYFARLLKEEGTRPTNIVVMGMGEPFHNYEATMDAVDRLNTPEGFNFGARRFTISTVGQVPMIRKFTAERRQVNLAVSLHAADDKLRNSLIPINRKYPLDELIEACREYVQKTGRRITFEWALIQDVNDTPEQARLLGEKIRGLLCHVNIIPLNVTGEYSGQPTTYERANAFKKVLTSLGIPCTIRVRRGIEIQAGCGQLASKQ